MRHTSFRDFLTRERISGGALLPDGETLLMSDSVWDQANERRADRLVLRNVRSGKEAFLTAPAGQQDSPVLSPDGKRVAFLCANGGPKQLQVTEIASGRTTVLTHLQAPVMDPRWSPDGQLLVFTSPAADESGQTFEPAFMPEMGSAWDHELDPVAIEDFGYKFDGLGFKRPSVMHLFVVPSDGSSEPRRISSGNCHMLHACFAADSRHVLCESNLFCAKENAIAMDLLSIDLETLEIRRLTENKWIVSYPNPVRPVCTTDGESVVIGLLNMPGTTDTASKTEELRSEEHTSELQNRGTGRGQHLSRLHPASAVSEGSFADAHHPSHLRLL